MQVMMIENTEEIGSQYFSVLIVIQAIKQLELLMLLDG